jgi:hypothetical protein
MWSGEYIKTPRVKAEGIVKMAWVKNASGTNIIFFHVFN